jgi:hypothetical protein
MNHKKLTPLLAQWDGEEDFAIMLANRPEQERLELLKNLDSYMQYIGYAGECRVMSELFIRGVEALDGRVDAGFDLVAMKGDAVTLVQVKTAFLGKDGIYSFNLAASDGEAKCLGKHAVCLVFVMVTGAGEAMDCLVLPQAQFEQELDAKNIWYVESTNRHKVKIYLRDGKAFLGKLENDRTELLNNWSPFLNDVSGKTPKTLA